MNIKLENVGIVKNADIKFDGLTVITGKNNSGKTTVGKALYSIVEAVSDLENKSKEDNEKHIYMDFKIISDKLYYLRHLYIEDGKSNKILSEYFPNLEKIITMNTPYEPDISNLIKTPLLLLDELRNFDYSFIENNELENLKQSIEQCKILLTNTIDLIEQDAKLKNYTIESINKRLGIEFDKQIQPLKVDVKYSKIILDNEDTLYFDLTIEKNIINKNNCVIRNLPFSKAYFIDNPLILDSARITRDLRYTKHEILLKNELLAPIIDNIFTEMAIDKKIEPVKKIIDEIIPGEFDFNSKGNYYIEQNKELSMCNLATGSKMFSIIKILLEKGKLDEDTVIILDEPEAHLHPSWQNKFAEVIVVLVKELNVNILLTSHSPNFVLAIDAFMRKYEVQEKTNFYQTQYLECNNMVEYKCLNDNMEGIYSDFMEFFVQVKSLRDSYCQNYGE